MKVVINKCFGGFGLSLAAETALIGKCEHTRLVEPIEYYGGPGSKFYEVHSGLGADEWRESYERDLKRTESEWAWTHFHDGKVVSDEHRNTENRACPELIRVIEELAGAANGRHADLGIIEIPDGVEWEISEYDGSEHIAESHRTWR